MKLRKILKISFFSILLLGLGVGSLIGIKLLFLYKEVKAINITDISLYEPTRIYDQSGSLITTLGIEQRELISYEEISPYMIDAITSIEDQRFFKHKGVDMKRIFAAVYENFTTGSYKEGASTITQQLVKLQFLTTDKTIERKVKEILISRKIEKKYKKEKILELYLNKVLFGGRIYGVENASVQYFNKPASDLTYEEAALLAGLVQSPNRYNPYRNPELTKTRQIEVLDQMLKRKKISEEEYQTGVDRPISELVVPEKTSVEEKLYYEYIDYVIQELQQKYNLDPFNDSLKVYTYLDPKAQDYVTELEKDNSLYKDEHLQTGIVVIENENGAIKAIGGGRAYKASLQFNYATDALIQPGSTIKPLLDYGPAIEYLNYAPGSQLVDEKIYYSTMGSRFMPIQNYDKRYKGTLTMREALIDSRNVTAVKVFREVGNERAYDFAERLGLNFRDTRTEANALGGFERGFNVLSLAGAYSTFGNYGHYIEPTTIRQVIDQEEKDITHNREKKRVMKDETAYLMTHMLHDNMENGTALRANVSGQYLAGKTGQTNFDSRTRERYSIPSNAVRDSWFIGYSEAYTTAVWVGYDKMGEGHYFTPSEAKLSLDLFRKVMQNVHTGKKTQPFERPDSVVEIEIELGTSPTQLPSVYTPTSFKRRELFIKGHEPQEISTAFKPLNAPDQLFVYFDDENEKLVLNWQKSVYDYDTNDYNVMAHIHAINKFYDDLKDDLLYEYYNAPNVYPSYRGNKAVMKKVNDYCLVNQDQLCITQNQLTIQQHTQLLDAVNRYERETIMSKYNNLTFLSEAEVADMRWKQSKLGQVTYTIQLHDGLYEKTIYQGPHRNQLEISMAKEEFVQYSAISIVSDFSNYPGWLQSRKETILNPYFALY